MSMTAQDTGLYRAKVPGSVRQVVHLFKVEPGYVSVRSVCGGTEADPEHLVRVPPYDAVSCTECARVHGTRTAENLVQGSLF